EKPAKPGDEDYPTKKSWDKVTKEEDEQISENLQYHIDNDISLTENVFRYGSESFFDLINEVRDLYHKNKITLDEMDKEVINSDVG
ncbi:MAG: hypothetical protein GTO02_01250, partial [Candidatus Dadabacteria bacterium]|nr:hypothetical protein [Candidatus Dadabacteria bacterium]